MVVSWSHLSILRQIVERNEIILVLEDDTCLRSKTFYELAEFCWTLYLSRQSVKARLRDFLLASTSVSLE